MTKIKSSNKIHLEWFNYGKQENPKFWNRLGGKPNFTGKICCDIGCGRGSLAIDMALSGAKKVIGFDIDEERIAFAKENLKQNFHQLVGVVEFHCQSFNEIEIDEQFDIITSKDAFEHIVDLQGMLNAIYIRLNKGGILYAGFGPLYYSFYGGHQRPRLIPWLHLFFPKDKLCKRLGLNGYSLDYIENALNNCGLSIISIKLNQGNRLKLFNPLLKIIRIREYFVHNVYAILEKGIGK